MLASVQTKLEERIQDNALFKEGTSSKDLIKDAEIDEEIRKVFPLDTATAVRAASGDTDARAALAELTTRRELLRDTITASRDRIHSRLKRYEDAQERETYRKELLDQMARRKGRLEKVDQTPELEKAPHLLMTERGHSVMVFTSAKDYVEAVSPELQKRGERDSIKKDKLIEELEAIQNTQVNGVDDSDGHLTFQAALDLTDEKGEGQETVIAILVHPEDVSDIGTDEYVNSLGFYKAEDESKEDQQFKYLLAARSDVLVHEDMHTLEFEMQIARRRALTELQREETRIRLEMTDQGFSKEEIESAVENLTQKKEALKNIEGDILHERWERGLSELSAHLMEPELGSNDLTLAEISVFNPENDEYYEQNDRDSIKDIDADLQKVLELVNHIKKINRENDPEAFKRILDNISAYIGINLPEDYATNMDVQFMLSELIQSYLLESENQAALRGKDGLQNMITMLRLISGKEVESMEPRYDEKTESERVLGTAQFLTRDRSLRLKDPVTIIRQSVQSNPDIFPSRKDFPGHMLAPLYGPYGVLPAGPLNVIPRMARAHLRYRMVPGYKEKWGSFDEFWKEVSYNPAHLPAKAEGLLGTFTQEILGGFIHKVGARGRTPEELTGVHEYRLDDQGRPTGEKPGEPISTGLIGNALAALPAKDMLFGTKTAPAGFGDAMFKILGRGPIAMKIGSVLFGEENMDPNDRRLDFNMSPRRHYVPGYTERDTQEGGSQLAPDGKPRVVQKLEGHMLPTWDYKNKKWKYSPYIRPEVVIPSMEHHRRATIGTMVGMLGKSGIDQQSLQLMIMQNMPEINLRRDGVIDLDITQFSNPLKETDLDYGRSEGRLGRLEGNRQTIQRYTQEVKRQFFGTENFDGDDREDVDDIDIIRGHVSDEYLEEMKSRLEDFVQFGLGQDNKKLKHLGTEHVAVVDHVFRAMQYENSIRQLRRKYLDADERKHGRTLSSTLSQWQTEVDDKFRKLTSKGASTRDAYRQAFEEVIESHGGQLQFQYKEGQPPVNLNADQIMKLFVRYEVDGSPLAFVADLKDQSNQAFGVGQLEKMAYNSEWNEQTREAGPHEVYLGGGFRLAKEEVQIFTRTLYYSYFERLLREGAPANTIFVPGASKMYDTYLREDVWNLKIPYNAVSDDDMMRVEVVRNEQTGQLERKQVRDQLRYNEYYWLKFRQKFGQLDPQTGDYVLQPSPRLNEIMESFGIDHNDPNAHQLLAQKFQGDFLSVVKVADRDIQFKKEVFGKFAEMQATLRNERNEPIPIIPVPPATDLVDRFFKDGAMIAEVEEQIEFTEEQNRHYAVMSNYLYRAREAMAYFKARSEIFKKRAEWLVKYPRWIVLSYTAAKFILPMALGIPVGLPFFPAWVYLATIAGAYYEGHYLNKQKKLNAGRELNAIMKSQDFEKITTQLEQKIRQFYIPNQEEVINFIGQKNTYEKMYEKIMDVEDDKLEPQENLITKALPALLAGGVSFIERSNAA